MKLRNILFAVLLVSALFACNKTATNAKRLINSGKWKVIELKADGTEIMSGTYWEIDMCDHSDELCYGEWKTADGGHALFAWQFREKGKAFELSRQEEEGAHSHGGADKKAAELCYGLSGVYDVTESSRSRMVLESTKAKEYDGKKVRLVIEQE